jgi:hypothetical protein
MSRVYPSGALRATNSVPIAPEAPGRFSTTNGWPNTELRWGAMTRAITSLLPPAPDATMILIGRAGQVSARAVATATRAAANHNLSDVCRRDLTPHHPAECTLLD